MRTAKKRYRIIYSARGHNLRRNSVNRPVRISRKASASFIIHTGTTLKICRPIIPGKICPVSSITYVFNLLISFCFTAFKLILKKIKLCVQRCIVITICRAKFLQRSKTAFIPLTKSIAKRSIRFYMLGIRIVCRFRI